VEDLECGCDMQNVVASSTIFSNGGLFMIKATVWMQFSFVTTAVDTGGVYGTLTVVRTPLKLSNVVVIH
jgi:hypothetical protein